MRVASEAYPGLLPREYVRERSGECASGRTRQHRETRTMAW
ncbi:hypothetical protein ACFPN7_16165 [Amycolatopsis halotolerans]